ncbi:ABC transporter permease [Actinokineospora fastidiosa]|uniref:Exporter of polyketide antibiotics n=1 Tax=Actinokineospora fastidiosa TaxID=1816 RepID=A0A918LC76_9PSEU|nr:ABC transporter permease [Actinokineospora fastidiosa]GGS28600.1 exporter of polyketide antibiotics [Actinokineospora fastidiosa]
MRELAGTGALVRLALRRDRILLPAWLLALVALAVTSAVATTDLYPTAESVAKAVSALNDTPAMVALYGRVHDPSSVGALAMLKALASGAVLVAALAVFLVVRHTRGEEEAGRAELLVAGPVGRSAQLTAAMVVVVGGSLLLGLASALALAASGLPLSGCFAFGLAWAGVGVAFAAVAAVAAQAVASARGAAGLAFGTLALTYALRGIGDAMGEQWLSWLSPIGWAQAVRPFAGDRWWAGLLPLTFAVAAVAAAYALAARRDLGAGLVPERAGPVSPGLGLRGPLSLAWRSHRGALAGWTAGFTAYGLLVGAVAGSAGDMLSSEQARELFDKLGNAGSLSDSVLAAMLGVLGVLAAAHGVQAVGRAHAEEDAGRAALVLAGPVGRTRWLLGHIAVALVGSALVLVAAGVAAGAVHALRLGDADQFARVMGAALARVPAAWVLVGVAAVGYGVFPRASGAAWAYLIAALLIGEVGPLLGLDGAVLGISPFTHVPALPGADAQWLSLFALAGVAAALVAAGAAGLRRRDLTGHQ